MRSLVVVILALVLLTVPIASSSPQEGATGSEDDSREEVAGSEQAPTEALEEFVPSEGITAGSSVSFPVDI